MNQTILRSIIYGLIACIAFYAGTFVNKFSGNDSLTPISDYNKAVKVIGISDYIASTEDTEFQAENGEDNPCEIIDGNYVNSRYCSAVRLNNRERKILLRIKEIKQQISEKIEELKKNKDEEVGTLRYMQNVPEYIDSTYKEWIEYRDTYCGAITESSSGGTGYGSFIRGCQYDEDATFIKFLDQIQTDWLD